MKKRIAVLIVVFPLLTTPLMAKVHASLSLGVMGEKALSSFYGGGEVSIGLQFTDEPWFRLEASVVLSPFFESVTMNMITEPFSLYAPAFDFLFQNPALWSPKLLIGGEYVYKKGWGLRALFGILNFRDKDFEYTFLSPMMTLSLDDYSVSYGFEVMRFTYVF